MPNDGWTKKRPICLLRTCWPNTPPVCPRAWWRTRISLLRTLKAARSLQMRMMQTRTTNTMEMMRSTSTRMLEMTTTVLPKVKQTRKKRRHPPSPNLWWWRCRPLLQRKKKLWRCRRRNLPPKRRGFPRKKRLN